MPLQKCEEHWVSRCRVNMAHVRQSRPGSGLGLQAKVLRPLKVDPSSLGSGQRCESGPLRAVHLSRHSGRGFELTRIPDFNLYRERFFQVPGGAPLSSEVGTRKAVKAGFHSLSPFSGESLQAP